MISWDSLGCYTLYFPFQRNILLTVVPVSMYFIRTDSQQSKQPPTFACWLLHELAWHYYPDWLIRILGRKTLGGQFHTVAKWLPCLEIHTANKERSSWWPTACQLLASCQCFYAHTSECKLGFNLSITLTEHCLVTPWDRHSESSNLPTKSCKGCWRTYKWMEL